MSRPLIGLLSDFGLRDHYVGTMKAVAAGVCPDLAFIDITHDVPPHDVLDAALQLSFSVPYFPPGSIFLVVVDPGVGGGRRGVAAECGEHRFVAPDNGVLTAVFDEHPPRRLVELSERKYFRPTVSRTFEGRDRFAPAAGWLARGVDLGALGRPVDDPIRIAIPVAEATDDGIRGAVLRIDRFGNAVTNIDRRRFERLADGRRVHIQAGGVEIGRLVATYGDIDGDEVCALFGSADRVELAAQSASAAERLGLKVGDPVVVALD